MNRHILFALITTLALCSCAASAATLGTAFTYQGRLTTGTNAASGIFDLKFSLYDAFTNGSQVGSSLTSTATGVTNGYFAVALDFGAVFDGNARWLETAVRTNGAVSFTALAPRQPLTAAPYATFAPNAGLASLASGVSTGAITSAMLADGAVTGSKIGSAAVKPANIDDGGSAAYETVLSTAKALSTTDPLSFDKLSLVYSNGGVAPALTFRLDREVFGTVVGFVGHEGISQPYEYVVEVIVTHPDLAPDAQVGRPGGLFFERRSRSTAFTGVITACSLASYEGTAGLYTFRIESPLVYLALSSDYRIYQDKTAPEVVSRLYSDVTSTSLRDALSGSYSARPVTMQFAETHLNFFNRLLEYDGICYYFQQAETTSTLVLADGLSSYLPAPYEVVRYYGNFHAPPHPAEECLRTFQKTTRESTKAASLTGYDFAAPRKNLLAKSSTSLGQGETFEFDARVTETSETEALARVRLESQRVERDLSSGTGNAPDLRPGYTFTLDDQSGSGLGGSYLVAAVRHSAFRRTTNGVSSLYYGNQVEVFPALAPYRPARKTPRPVVPACTAVVVGKAGEEIWTDKYGRVKVQFPWDRYGANNENSSGWIRVASQLAGKNWGMIFIPRIGQEVMVEFVNGDPDQPVITGSFYNGDNMPPYDLPANATQSGVKTRSSKGGTFDNFNEIRFEDKKGSEQLFIHAEKNFDREVENDMTSWVGHDAKLTVDNDLTSTVKHDWTVSVWNNLNITASQGIGINTANNPAIALNVGGTVAATSFQGNGAGLVNLAATNLTGTISDGRLSANVGLLAGSQTFTNAAFTGSVTLSGAAASLTVAAAAPVTFQSGPLFNAATPFAVTSTARIANLNAAYAGIADSASNADTLDGLHASGFALAVHGHDAAALVTGTLNDARLSLNVPRLDGSQSFSGNNAFLGRVAIGGPMGLDTLTINGTARLNNYDLFLRGSGDLNHGLGWYGTDKLFAGVNLDGPVLYGCDGGGLGTACGSQKLALRWRSDGNVAIDPVGVNTGTLVPGLTFGWDSGEGIASKRNAGGNQYGLDFYTGYQPRLSISQAGKIGIGTTNPAVMLDVVGAIRSTGAIRSGSETGAAPPGYPSGSDGLVIRRARSTSTTAGTVVARTDKLTLERDGSTSGLRLSYPVSPGYQVVNCIGISTNGTQIVYRNTVKNPGSAGSLVVFSDAQKIVHYDISFGDTYSSTPGHTTHVVLDRYDDGVVSDNYLVGTITSTYNQ